MLLLDRWGGRCIGAKKATVAQRQASRSIYLDPILVVSWRFHDYP